MILNLPCLSHSFGYDSGRRANLQLLDDRTLIFIAGNLLVLLDVSTKEQRYLRSCSGGGIGSIAVRRLKKSTVTQRLQAVRLTAWNTEEETDKSKYTVLDIKTKPSPRPAVVYILDVCSPEMEAACDLRAV